MTRAQESKRSQFKLLIKQFELHAMSWKTLSLELISYYYYL